jgi:hypothetical protein
MAGLLQQLLEKLGGKVVKAATKAVGTKTYSFPSLPQTLEQLKALPEASLTDCYAVAALTVVALLRYEADPEACFAMLNFLKGPEPLSNLEKQHIQDRMAGKGYKPRSFFVGATPENNYTPTNPYTIRVASNPYSFDNEGWATLWLKSGGGDNERPVKLRKKPSTGQWFLNEIQYLSDIRLPVAEDKWA